MPAQSGPKFEIQQLLNASTHPERTKALEEVLAILAKSPRYGYRPATTEQNQRKSQRNVRVNREFIDRSFHRRRWYTEDEMVVVRDLSITHAEAARKLGRTPKGVEHARKKIRKTKVQNNQTL